MKKSLIAVALFASFAANASVSPEINGNLRFEATRTIDKICGVSVLSNDSEIRIGINTRHPASSLPTNDKVASIQFSSNYDAKFSVNPTYDYKDNGALANLPHGNIKWEWASQMNPGSNTDSGYFESGTPEYLFPTASRGGKMYFNPVVLGGEGPNADLNDSQIKLIGAETMTTTLTLTVACE